MFRKEHRWNLIFFLAGHVIESLLHKEESSLIFSAKKLNCIVPQTVCLLSKVNRYTAELSFGSLLNTLSRRAQMSTEVSIKLFTRRRIKRQDRRRCSVSISLNFYETILELSLQTKFLFNIKKLLLLIIDAQTLFPGKQRTTCLPKFRQIPKEGHITDYSKAESTVQPAMLRYSSTSQFVIHFVAFHYDMIWN